MSFFSSIWNGLLEGLESILRFYEGLMEPIAGGYAWGLSIILLTVTVRVFLIPLMVRQTKSMRSMQKIQPELKRIKEKYKADRSMMKTDPERYKKLKEKEREAQMALYQEHQVNPVGGCLPLILQMPIFLALFRVLQDERVEELATAPFFGVNSLADTASSQMEIGALILVVLQVVTTYYSQKQMQARNTTASGDQAQAQKLMLYIMPVFLGYLSFTFPVGVVLYWVTTNFWTIGQQYFIFKQVEKAEADAIEERKKTRRASGAGDGASGSAAEDGEPTSSSANRPTRKAGSSSGRSSNGKPSNGRPSNGKPSSGKPSNGKSPNGKSSSSKSSSTKGAASTKSASSGSTAAKGASSSGGSRSARGGAPKRTAKPADPERSS